MNRKYLIIIIAATCCTLSNFASDTTITSAELDAILSLPVSLNVDGLHDRAETKLQRIGTSVEKVPVDNRNALLSQNIQRSHGSESLSKSVFQYVRSMTLVVLLLGVILYVTVRISRNGRLSNRKNADMTIMSRIHLDTRNALILVDVRGDELLIAKGNHGISKLHCVKRHKELPVQHKSKDQ